MSHKKCNAWWSFTILRILGKNHTLVRVIHFFFQLGGTGLSREGEEVVQHLEGFQIERLGIAGSRKDSRQPGANLLQNRQRICDYNSANRCTKNDDQFGRLHQHVELAVFHHVPAGNGTQHNDNSND